MSIKINNTELRIRPSAVDGFFQCSYQWGKTFLEGINTIPNARAAIGTSIHAGIEQAWNDSIKAGTKTHSLSAMTDAAIQAWKEETHDGVKFDDGENEKTAVVEILKGTEAFVEDIMPFAALPTAVEQFYKVDIAHALVKELGGTVDYITNDTIADVKTSKRKPTPSNYTTQQSVYKYLAQANGVDVKHNMIHGVTLGKTGASGSILPMETDVDQAKVMVNTMLDTLDLIVTDKAPIDLILRGNPKYYLCSDKYCALYPCKFVKGM